MEPLRPTDPARIGDHQLLARLGEGGMGVVYLGRTRGGRHVAIKVVRERFAADPAYRARFRREVTSALGVTGTFTAPLLAADPEAASPWLVTEYLPGLTLREAVAGYGPLPADAVRALSAGLAEALVDIHRAGIAHRDLKPSNILLTATGPRVIDFGIARPEDGTAITLVGSVIGTPGYMSPEQASGARTGPSSDVFSLGAVLFFAATGKDPAFTDFRTDLSALDPWLRDFVGSCLQITPDLRPTAAQLLERAGHSTLSLPPAVTAAIGRFDERPIVASGAPTIPPTADEKPRRRTLLIAGAATALAAIGGGIALLSNRSGPLTATSTPPPTTTTPPVTSVPMRKAVRRWQLRVSEYFPALTAAGTVLIAITEEEQFHAIDPATGTVLWTKLGNTGYEVSGDTVFVPHNAPTRIAAVEARSGAVRWEYRTPFPTPGRPLTAGPWGSFGGMIGIGHGPIGALGVGDGRVRWRYDIEMVRGIAADESLVVVLSDTNEMIGLRATDGAHLFTQPYERGVGGPLVAGGMVFINDKEDVLRAIRADGTLAWKRPNLGIRAALRWDRGTLYTDGNGLTSALDAATGQARWSRHLGGGGSTLTAVNGMLYAACADKNVYAVDGTSGQVLWTYAADAARQSATSNVDTGPVVIGGQVFIGTREGFVEALDPPEGGPRATP